MPCFDDAAAKVSLSSQGWELLSRKVFRDTVQTRAVVIDLCCMLDNHPRRHSTADGLSPVNYETRETNRSRKRLEKPLHDLGEPQRRR